MCRMARPSVQTPLPDLQGTLMPHFISDLPGLLILRPMGKMPHQVRQALIFFPACLSHFLTFMTTKFILFSTLLSLASSSSSSPSELSEDPASDGVHLASAAGASNQLNDSGLSVAVAAAATATAAAAACSSQAATVPKSGPASSISVATPTPRIAPINNGPLPPG